jgi:hypothetical protein
MPGNRLAVDRDAIILPPPLYLDMATKDGQVQQDVSPSGRPTPRWLLSTNTSPT